MNTKEPKNIWLNRDPNTGWACRSCNKEIEENFKEACPHCGNRCQFIEYRGFKLKGTGGFFSGDGYVIYYVPPFLSENEREEMLGIHMQDSTLIGWINKIYERFEE